MDSFVMNVLGHDVLDFEFEFEKLGVVMEVHHFDSIDPAVVSNTVDYEEAVAAAVEVVDDHNWMVDTNVEVAVEIEEDEVHLDDVNLDGNLNVERVDDVERGDDLHMDTAAVDYQSDETDDAVAVDYDQAVEGADNTAADLPDCNTDLVVVDNVHYEVHHAAGVETEAVLDK